MEFLEFLADYRHPVLDVFFQIITFCAQETLVVAVICWLFWCQNKKLAYTLGFSYFASGLGVQAAKITFRVPRPWVLNPDFSPVASAVEGATGYSFPSGHTQSATALFGTLSMHFKSASKKLLCAIAFLLVGFSRMYLGVHTPQDVFTSMAATLAVSVLLFRFFSKERDAKWDAPLALVLFLTTLALLIYTQFLYQNGTLETKYAMDCFKACGAGFGFAAGFYLERRFIRFSLPSGKRQKLLRYLAGLTGVLILQLGLKLLLPENVFTSVLRYFILVFWVLVLYPYIFSSASNKRA